MNALAQMEMETLLKKNSFFSCQGRATNGSSCNGLEKMNLLKKVVMYSWIKLLKNTVSIWNLNYKQKKNALD
jgi:hypothetical protein